MIWVTIITIVGACVSALLAVRARRLLVSALWLACSSAFLSALFYALGAHTVAVIELSVGAGLVTILFVFGISIAGDEGLEKRPLVHWTLAAALILIALGLLGWFVLPAADPAAAAATELPFAAMLWQQRGLDVMVQIGLIFAGVLGILGILAEVETASAPRTAVAAPPAAKPPAPEFAAADAPPAPALIKES